ncbi:hypothetical protein ACVWWO_000334 [Bradyrhizobium sp. F1.13.1]
MEAWGADSGPLGAPPDSLDACRTSLRRLQFAGEPADRVRLHRSTAKRRTSVRLQVEHSKVRSSNPRGPGEMRANAIRCLQSGHIGRSLFEAVIPQILVADDTLSEAGVSTKNLLPSAKKERDQSARVGPAGPRASAACVALPQALHKPQRRGCACNAISRTSDPSRNGDPSGDLIPKRRPSGEPS